MEQVKTNTTVATQATSEGIAQVGMGITLASAGVIGLWGITCFVSALAQNGVLAMAKGWFMAVGG